MIPPADRLRRLLVLLPSAGLGGAEAHTATLVRALAGRGVTVSVAAEPGLHPGLARLLGDAAALHPLPIGWREAEDLATNAARQAGAIAPLLAMARPDAALLPLPWPTHGLGLLIALAEARVATLAVAHLAPVEAEPIPPRLRRQLAGALAGMPVTWAAVSGPVAQRLAATLGLPLGQVAVVPNGVIVPSVDPARRDAQRRLRRASLGLGPDAPLVLFAGRLEPKKGAELLPALAEALRRSAGATLVALGDGPLAPRLAVHPAAGPDGPLRLLGQVAEVPDWLLAADGLVLPSTLEGCPLIYLEAAAHGCPVVATRPALEWLGDRCDVVAFVTSLPTIANLTSHICEMLTKTPRHRGRISAAHALAMTHTQDIMLARYFALLRACRPAGISATL